ncbi:MAG: HEPN domain-containing protein [Bacteroidetes bacterium]|nr:MAG: HEPN domain-containing protein [Bacteroidota bacterium]
MKDYQKELIKYRLQKSEYTYNDAVYLAEGKKWNSSANRLYYLAFYALQTLLISYELTSKTHKVTKQLFHNHFLINNLIEKEYGDSYTLLFEAKQESDYSDFTEQSEESIKYFVSKTRLFINRITEFIRENRLKE